MSIMRRPAGKINERTRLRLKVLDWSFFARKITAEFIEDLRYKLRCFVVPVDGPAKVFCDKKSVVNNLSIPTLVLK